MTVDFFIHAPSREVYAAVLPSLTLPGGEPLARLPDEEHGTVDGNALCYPEGIAVSEIGAIVKVPGTYDEEGNELTPPEIVPGYHVNMRAYGAVAELLTAGLPQTGSLFERTHILALLDGLEWVAEPTAEGVPAGYVGPNGIRIIDPASVATPARVWG